MSKEFTPKILFHDGTVQELESSTLTHQQIIDILGNLYTFVECKSKGSELIINDTGKLEGLPLNENATRLYKFGSLNPGDWINGEADFIAGNAILSRKGAITIL